MTAANSYQNQKPPSNAAQEPRAREPSMEDILASIRRIIADDQLQAGRPGFGSLRRSAQPAITAPTVPEAFALDTPQDAEQIEALDDVLDLAGMPDAVATPAPHYAAIAAEPHPEPAAVHDVYRVEPEAAPSHETPGTFANGDASASSNASDDVAAAIAEAGRTAAYRQQAMAEAPRPAQLRQLQPSPDGSESLISAAPSASVLSAFETLAATVVLQNDDLIDRVMRDLLRPLLKTWLDDNLPTLVERLVRTEIERVARGNRS